eukprot:INCI16585.2.p1 GENE.INCI16585.2~~INCI16585.2.p1  ORF type:complete len:551 (-),score=121.31 INCI16585.2:314-1966(-)
MSHRYGRGGPRGRTFGAAKPLPGQKGYGETESQKVEAQVAAMEARLAMMKVALTAEKEKTSGAVQQDGSRWRSGGVNAGSLSRYDKDINRRGGRRKKRGDSATRGPSSSSSKFVSKNFSNRSRGDRRAGGPKSMSGQKTPRGGRENAEEWSQAEVGQWLTSIGLPQYKTVFHENAIDGAVLVEMGTEDLDYLNIKALGHRKMILGGLAEIRVDKSAATSSASASSQASRQAPAPQQKEPLKPRKHWAVAAAENQRRIDERGGLPPVQAAGTADTPLNQGHYDEAAQSALFQQSVMEWRKARAAAKAAEAGASEPSTKEVAPSKLTVGPDGAALDGGGSLLQGKYDEEEQSRLFKESVMQWRRDKARAEAGGAPDGSEWVNPFGAAEAEIQHPPPHKDGGKLLKGELNESEEHEKFREAVLSWRTKGKSGNATSPSRRSSCWQCFKVLPSGNAPLQIDGKNICSRACLEHAQKAKAEREERQKQQQRRQEQTNNAKVAPESDKPLIQAGVETAAGKEIFQANSSGAEEVRYTGEDLNNLLNSDAWKVAVDY